MKLAITRFVIVAAIAVLMVAVGSTAAWAETPPCPSSPSYSPDFSSNQSCLTPNDNASPFPILFDGNNVLQLTSSTSNQIGAAWYNTPQPVENGFTTSFQFQFTGASTPPADGIAFVIQNSTSKLNAIGFTGGNGGAIGYGDDDNNLNPSTGGGIPNSLAIGQRPAARPTRIRKSESTTGKNQREEKRIFMKLGVVRFFIAAATAVLLVIAGSTAASAQCPASTTSPNYTPDFSNASNQLCLTLTSGGEANDGGYPNFASPASPSGTVNPALPVPTNVLRVLRLTQNATFTTGSAFFTAPQPVAGPFSTTFTFQMSDSNTSTTADGIAFVIQSSSATALDPDVGGTDGCSLGYGDDPAGSGCTSATGGIPNSLAIEFDPYQNADDPNNNHVAIQSCGSTTAEQLR